MGDEFDRQVVPLLATLTVAGMVFFDLLAPRAEPLAHLRGPVAYQDTGVAPWCPKNAASPSSFANFMPLAASMTDSSNCATVHCAWARCLRFQCM